MALQGHARDKPRASSLVARADASSRCSTRRGKLMFTRSSVSSSTAGVGYNHAECFGPGARFNGDGVMHLACLHSNPGLSRASLNDTRYKDRKQLAAALKPIDTATDEADAAAQLEAFAVGPRDRKFPSVAAAWRRAWVHVVPFLDVPPDIRRVIYATNAIPVPEHPDALAARPPGRHCG
jgi:hypothetical protein